LQDGDIIGSEEEEQEDPKDYLKGIFLKDVNTIKVESNSDFFML